MSRLLLNHVSQMPSKMPASLLQQVTSAAGGSQPFDAVSKRLAVCVPCPPVHRRSICCLDSHPSSCLSCCCCCCCCCVDSVLVCCSGRHHLAQCSAIHHHVYCLIWNLLQNSVLLLFLLTYRTRIYLPRARICFYLFEFHKKQVLCF